jgi:hypothetical protein
MVLLSCSLAKQDEEADARSPAVIISEATAQRFWPKPDALGQTLRLELDRDDPRCKETSSYDSSGDWHCAQCQQRDGISGCSQCVLPVFPNACALGWRDVAADPG